MSAEKLVSPRIQLYLAVGLLAAAMGCSGLDSATGTTADDTVQASEAAAAPTDASRKATHDSLKAIAAQERERIHQAREQHKEEFAAARQAWNAYRKAIAEAKKHKRDFTIEVLRCEPQEYAGDAQVIGPEGGTLHVGKHELKIPKAQLRQLRGADGPQLVHRVPQRSRDGPGSSAVDGQEGLERGRR